MRVALVILLGVLAGLGVAVATQWDVVRAALSGEPLPVPAADGFQQSEGAAVAGGPASAPGPGAAAAIDRSGRLAWIGINLDGVADWSTLLPFINLTQTARGRLPQTIDAWDTGDRDRMQFTADGWPTNVPGPGYTRVGTLMLREIAGLFPGGRHVVRYRGRGRIEYGFGAELIGQESRPGRHMVTVDADNNEGFLLTIHETDPDDPIRDIVTMREAHEPLWDAGQRYNPDFVDFIRPFPVLRFMQWAVTNDGRAESRWRDRPVVDQFTWQGTGVPLEVMIDLSNQMGASPWFTLPHLADDDYIRRYATMVRDRLDPAIPVYVELSNEVWNWSYPQAHHAQAQAEARWGPDVEGGWMQWYGMRAAEMIDIWMEVFAGQEDRVIGVFATQAGWMGLEQYALDAPNHVAAGGRPPREAPFRAYAIAPYFGGSLGSPEMVPTIERWASMGEAGFAEAAAALRDPEREDSIPGIRDWVRHHRGVADGLGWDLIAYEGGQHLVGHGGAEQNETVTAFFQAMNRRAEMGDLYRDYLSAWRQEGGGLFMHYSAVSRMSRWGSFGVLEALGRSSPRLEALLEAGRQ